MLAVRRDLGSVGKSGVEDTLRKPEPYGVRASKSWDASAGISSGHVLLFLKRPEADQPTFRCVSAGTRAGSKRAAWPRWVPPVVVAEGLVAFGGWGAMEILVGDCSRGLGRRRFVWKIETRSSDCRPATHGRDGQDVEPRVKREGHYPSASATPYSSSLMRAKSYWG